MKTPSNKKNVPLFKTADFNIAAFMIMLGFSLVDWDRDDNNNKRLFFIFDLQNTDNINLRLQNKMDEVINSCNYVKNDVNLRRNLQKDGVDDEDFRKLYMVLGFLDDYSMAQKTLKKVIYNDDKSKKVIQKDR